MKGAFGLLVLVIAGILGYEVVSGHAADLINAFRGNTNASTPGGGTVPTSSILPHDSSSGQVNSNTFVDPLKGLIPANQGGKVVAK